MVAISMLDSRTLLRIYSFGGRRNLRFKENQLCVSDSVSSPVWPLSLPH